MKRVLALTVLIALSVFTESNILSAANAAAEQTASDAFPTGNAHNALFTNEWKFFKGDDDQSRGASFDDTAWRTLDLPHDWSVEASFDPKLASCTAFLPGGVAWYRKHFVVPADVKNKCISIRFDGISNHSTVWCNGVQVGERPYGYSSFTCDLTPAIHFGGENVIAVRVNHAQYADSRWYAGSGIYRNVYLNVTGKLHIATYGTFVTTPKITDDFAEVNVQTAVKNEGTAAIDATIATEIIDDKGASVAKAEQSGSVPAAGQKHFAAALQVPHPNLWSPDHPRSVLRSARRSEARGNWSTKRSRPLASVVFNSIQETDSPSTAGA